MRSAFLVEVEGVPAALGVAVEGVQQAKRFFGGHIRGKSRGRACPRRPDAIRRAPLRRR